MKLPRLCRRRWFRLGLLAVLGWVVLWFGVPFAVPLPQGLLATPDSSPTLLDRHGAVIEHLTLPDFTRCSPVPLERIPADLIACTLAAEDKRFLTHGGVDLLATGRAAFAALTRRGVRSGASTITQQLIKISSPPQPRTIATKLREVLAARHLEMLWSKQQILEAYLNRLSYGCLRLGPEEAARWYFQKPLADISLAEAALLAGLPQAPTRLNPLTDPSAAVARRNTVLKRLTASGGADPARIAAALTEAPAFRPLREPAAAPWLSARVDPAKPAGPIRTTLDLPLQRAVSAIVREETAKLRTSNLRHAAVVVIHNPSGDIRALVSSADWDDPRGGQINGALSPRSPGSALKPFTYLLALERLHATPVTLIADIPSPFRTPQGLSLPENYDRAYRGPVTLRTALACSLNVPALRQLNDLGGPQPLFDLLASLDVLDDSVDPVLCGLGLTLGNAPVRLLDLTNAYAGLARHGIHLPPRLFQENADIPHPLRFAAPTSVYQISHILSDRAARAPAFGSGGPLELPFACAVKTGTSSDFRDNWCLGYTPDFTVGVWAGNFENQPMKGISGVAGAAPIFHRVMVEAQHAEPPRPFERPPGLTDLTCDIRTGKSLASGETPNTDNSGAAGSSWKRRVAGRMPAPPVARAFCPEPSSTQRRSNLTVLGETPANPFARRDVAPDALVPPPATAADYDSAGRALLPPLYSAWFASPHNLRRAELALDPAPAQPEPLRIILPAPDATYLLDPEIPSGSDRLRPLTNLPGVARWSSPTLRIEPATPEPVIHLTPGSHTLTATDPRTGTSQTLTLIVKEL